MNDADYLQFASSPRYTPCPLSPQVEGSGAAEGIFYDVPLGSRVSEQLIRTQPWLSSGLCQGE